MQTAVTTPSAEPAVLKVVIALCYEGPNRFYIIDNCPYCFCSHKHRSSRQLAVVASDRRHRNGEVALYEEGMVTKISDCQTTARTYALELRKKEDIPLEPRKHCRGTTRKGKACQRYARLGHCLCLAHDHQMADLVGEQLDHLKLV
jgi:hypothetical protein